MRSYSKIVKSEADYIAEIKKLIELGYRENEYGTDYASFVLDNKEIKILRCYRCR